MPEKKYQNKIAIIIPYFGKLPWYFDYFIHTCKYNPTIQFFIITDENSYNNIIPKNVSIIQRSFEKLKIDIGEKLQMEVSIEMPYKLCDFRPAYGIIFSDIIKDFDFWGYGDIDVIFGNIRNFISTEMLKRYDIISMRHDYLTGCFAVFRNSERINNLYKKSKGYEKVFTDSRNFAFDETNYCYNEFAHGMHYSMIESEVESMTHLTRRMHEENYISAYFDFHVIEGLPGKMKWQKGTLIFNKRFEVVLYHLIKLKAVYNPQKVLTKIPETFYISSTRIYT